MRGVQVLLVVSVLYSQPGYAGPKSDIIKTTQNSLTAMASLSEVDRNSKSSEVIDGLFDYDLIAERVFGQVKPTPNDELRRLFHDALRLEIRKQMAKIAAARIVGEVEKAGKIGVAMSPARSSKPTMTLIFSESGTRIEDIVFSSYSLVDGYRRDLHRLGISGWRNKLRTIVNDSASRAD